MRDKRKDYCNNTAFIMIFAVVSAIAGGVLGVFAYYRHWLG